MCVCKVEASKGSTTTDTVIMDTPECTLMNPDVNYQLQVIMTPRVGSSITINVSLWWGMLTKVEARGVNVCTFHSVLLSAQTALKKTPATKTKQKKEQVPRPGDGSAAKSVCCLAWQLEFSPWDPVVEGENQLLQVVL